MFADRLSEKKNPKSSGPPVLADRTVGTQEFSGPPVRGEPGLIGIDAVL
jgi:hypothetical protein